MQAVINSQYPNRIQLQLSASGGTAIGPLTSSASVAFNPSTDLEIYVDGVTATVQSSTYDAVNDQYLIFTIGVIATTSVVQVIYHIPVTPFSGTAGVIPGFSLIASVSTSPDPAEPTLGIAVLTSTTPSYLLFPVTGAVPTVSTPLVEGVPIQLNWFAEQVGQVEITGSEGFTSGMIPAATVYGSVPISGLISGSSVTITISAYDATGAPVSLNSQDLTVSFLLQIT